MYVLNLLEMATVEWFASLLYLLFEPGFQNLFLQQITQFKILSLTNVLNLIFIKSLKFSFSSSLTFTRNKRDPFFVFLLDLSALPSKSNYFTLLSLQNFETPSEILTALTFPHLNFVVHLSNTFLCNLCCIVHPRLARYQSDIVIEEIGATFKFK